MIVARALVPIGARIVVFVIHRGQLLQPPRLCVRDQRLAITASGVPCARGKLLQDLFSGGFCVRLNAHRHLLGQSDTVGVYVHLNDFRILRPIVDPIAGQRRKRIEPRPKREHHIGLRDQLHRSLGAVVAERPDRQRMAAGERVVVLVIAADRRIQALRQLTGCVDRIAKHDAGTVENDRELRLGQQFRRIRDRAAPWLHRIEPDHLRQLDIDHLSPEIARHVDLRRRRAAAGFLDHAIQHFRNAGGVSNFLLIADDVSEKAHLLHFLEAALTDGLVCGLRGDQQQWRMVPVGGLDRRHEVGDAGSVLRDGHRHLARGARVAVGAHARVALVRAVPELDASFREQIRYWHHRRSDNAESVLDAVHLQHFHKGFFGRHFHCAHPPAVHICDACLP